MNIVQLFLSRLNPHLTEIGMLLSVNLFGMLNEWKLFLSVSLESTLDCNCNDLISKDSIAQGLIQDLLGRLFQSWPAFLWRVRLYWERIQQIRMTSVSSLSIWNTRRVLKEPCFVVNRDIQLFHSGLNPHLTVTVMIWTVNQSAILVEWTLVWKSVVVLQGLNFVM